MEILKKFRKNEISKQMQAKIKGGYIIQVDCGSSTLTCIGSRCQGTDQEGCKCTDHVGNLMDKKDCIEIVA